MSYLFFFVLTKNKFLNYKSFKRTTRITICSTIDSYTMTGDTVDLMGILSAGVNFVQVFVGKSVQMVSLTL